MMMRSLRLGCALAVLAVAAPGVRAQDVTGTVRGDVTDENGAPIPNATVTVVHTPSGTRSVVATDQSGSFSASNLRIGGPFAVTVSAQGFDTATTTIASISPGQPQRIDVFLAAVGTTIAVTANRLRSSIAIASGPATSLNVNDIQGIATINRDIRDLARRDPFVTLDPTNSRAISIAGQNNRFNRVTVDGIAFGDPFGLNNGGLASIRGPVPIDAIGEFTVEVAPADIQQGGFQGGAINTVLKSGGNEFTGSAFYTYSDDGLAGNNTRGQIVDRKFRSNNMGAQLTGPLIKDKLFFAVTWERLRAAVPAFVGLQGEGFANSIPGLTRATVDQIKGIATSRYKYDTLDVAKNVPETDDKVVAKIDWNIADGHRAAVTYIYNKGDILAGQTLASTLATTSPTLSLQSNNYTQGEINHYGVFQLNDEWSDVFSTQARVSYNDYKRLQVPFNGRTLGQFTVCTDPVSTGSLTSCTAPAGSPQNPQVAFGPDVSRQANELRVKSLAIELQALIKKNDHSVKIIAERRSQDIDNLFAQNVSGDFYFDSIADLQAGKANRLVLAVPVNGDIDSVRGKFKNINWTFGVQDVWDAADGLTLTYGFRYDLYETGDVPALNPNFVARYGFANNSTLNGRGIFQPRFGLNWRASDRFRVRGSLGVYAGGSPNVWVSNSYSNPGTALNQTTIQRTASGFTGVADFGGQTANQIGSASMDNVLGGQAIPGILQQFIQRGLSSLAVTNAIDPAFKIPNQTRGALSFDYAVNFGETLGDDWNFGADVVWSKVNQGIAWTDLRSVRNTVGNGVLPDGRPRYQQTVNNLGTGGSSLADGNQDVLLYNTKAGYSWNIVARMRKKWDNGISIGASYLWQRAKDVNSGTSSVALSNYSQTAAADPNFSAYGTSNYQIDNSLKLSFGYETELFRDAKTRFDLFFESRAGQRYSFTFADTTPTRSSVFGTTGTNNRYLIYVPNVSSITADPRVSYSSQAFFNDFQKFVQNSELNAYQGQIAPKNLGRAPRFNKLDLRVSQEIPFFYGSKFELFGDIENVLNLLDKDWGSLRQVSFPYYGTLANVSCVQTVGGLPTVNPGQPCAQFVYTGRTGGNFSAPALTFDNISLWQIRIGARFKF
ncbi:TonB-dependent receptor [Sandaracinobacteroides saxicola]|uniref:TonB-dependent receptor n=1 Tax=Sandaracinobacteroides saxicola TaxID=2759707 RepID=A0A7G5IKH6_9SPHN|nr:TonB-dependent receptor [Sandaracinobacteroides saxicola]QMW23868.1 TonB-dependent receptor [Sandaracinobacteroides saxicola]